MGIYLFEHNQTAYESALSLLSETGKVDLIEYTEMMNKAKKILMDYDHDKE